MTPRLTPAIVTDFVNSYLKNSAQHTDTIQQLRLQDITILCKAVKTMKKDLSAIITTGTTILSAIPYHFADGKHFHDTASVSYKNYTFQMVARAVFITPDPPIHKLTELLTLLEIQRQDLLEKRRNILEETRENKDRRKAVKDQQKAVQKAMKAQHEADQARVEHYDNMGKLLIYNHALKNLYDLIGHNEKITQNSDSQISESLDGFDQAAKIRESLQHRKHLIEQTQDKVALEALQALDRLHTRYLEARSQNAALRKKYQLPEVKTEPQVQSTHIPRQTLIDLLNKTKFKMGDQFFLSKNTDEIRDNLEALSEVEQPNITHEQVRACITNPKLLLIFGDPSLLCDIDEFSVTASVLRELANLFKLPPPALCPTTPRKGIKICTD